jgi:hypothetical protein
MMTAPFAIALSALLAFGGQYAGPDDANPQAAAKPLRFSGIPGRTYVAHQSDLGRLLAPGDNQLFTIRSVDCHSAAGCGLLVTSSVQLVCKPVVSPKVAITYSIDEGSPDAGPQVWIENTPAPVARRDLIMVGEGIHTVTPGIRVQDARKRDCSVSAVEADVAVLEN